MPRRGYFGCRTGVKKTTQCKEMIIKTRVVSQTGYREEQKGKGRRISRKRGEMVTGGEEEEKISNNTTSPGIPDPGRLVSL